MIPGKHVTAPRGDVSGPGPSRIPEIQEEGRSWTEFVSTVARQINTLKVSLLRGGGDFLCHVIFSRHFLFTVLRCRQQICYENGDPVLLTVGSRYRFILLPKCLREKKKKTKFRKKKKKKMQWLSSYLYVAQIMTVFVLKWAGVKAV